MVIVHGTLVGVLSLIILCHGFRELDTWKFEEGKRQYDVMERNRNMPKYGQCWTNTIDSLNAGCKEITDELQTRLALAYLNCFLMTQGRPPYPCEPREPLHICTQDLAESDRSSLATFFTHTHNICYFLQSQTWHENTENAITRLSATSDQVAVQLEESSHLQQRVIQQQNLSLSNQKAILDQASNLSSVINESTNNIHGLFDEYQKTTSEQRILISEIFDRVSRIQSLIIGEFVGFKSVLIYTLATIICYLLTSTAKTSSARLPLFGIVIINFLMEKTIFSLIVNPRDNLTRTEEADQNERLYQYQWVCREVSSMCGVVVLVVCAYRFRDMNTINNQLLLDIKRQNMEIKQALQAGQTKQGRENYFIDDRYITTITNKAAVETGRLDTETNSDAESDDCGYHSNSQMPLDPITQVVYKESPQNIPATYPDTDTCSESSFTTALSANMAERSRCSTRSSSRSMSRSLTFKRELGNLQDISGIAKLRENILNWTRNGCYDADIEESFQENTEVNLKDIDHPTQVVPSKVDAPVKRRYNMRQRTPRGSGSSKARSNL